MKKLFGIIAIALLFSFAGMQEVYAGDWDIKVTWDDNCDDCPAITGHEYYVCLKITNTCTETVVYDMHCVIISAGTFEYTFNVGEICVSDSELCFDVSPRVIKRCVVSQETICQNTEVYPRSCDDITSGFTISCNIPY